MKLIFRRAVKARLGSEAKPARLHRNGKVLNQCEDSKSRTTVTNRTIVETSFINNLRSVRRGLRFSAVIRYADKVFVMRVFLFGRAG
jgi:hypothetical protein